jgi:hypothetical protein
MICHICAGSTDPFEQVLSTLCLEHLLEAVARLPTDAELQAALEEGARQAALVAAHEVHWWGWWLRFL